MAVEFDATQSIIEGPLYDEYNNSIVRFRNFPTGLYPAVKATVEIDGYSFEVTPDTGLYFKFNFKEIVKVLLNINTNTNQNYDYDFDTILANNPTLILKAPEATVDYTITLSDASTVTDSKNYKWLKSVRQLGDGEYRFDSNSYLLNHNNLTFFKGYPFEISFFGRTSGDMTITNSTNGTSDTVTLNSTFYVPYYPMSSGKYLRSEENNEITFNERILAMPGGEIVGPECCYTFEETYLLNVGENNITFETTGTVMETTIKLVDNTDGVYLKWLNDDGAWSYWLFSEIYIDNVKTKTADTYKYEDVNLADAYQEQLITGKVAQNILNLNYQNLTVDEVTQLRSILTSNYVQMYTGTYGESIPDTPWITVNVLDGNFTLRNTKRNLSNLGIRIEKNLYTQI